MEVLTSFVLKVVGPVCPSDKVKMRVHQERQYEKSLRDFIAREKDIRKKAELEEELLLCQRRVEGFVSVYPVLGKVKEE